METENAIMSQDIGQAILVIESVSLAGRNIESAETDEVWLIGAASGYWEASVGGVRHRTDIAIDVGCWTDTDDDGFGWCADNEGARAINAAFGLSSESDTRGDFSRLAYPVECEAIGVAICAALRLAAQE